MQIGPYTYHLKEDQAAFHKACFDNDGRVWGYIRYDVPEIVVDPGQGPIHKRVTLVHELLHAIWHLADTGHDGDEKPARILATGLLDMFYRNPELVQYLMRGD